MLIDRNLPSADIPTSSMADIAFLLVIYFMLTTTFAATMGLDLQFPEEPEHPAAVDPVESVHLRVLPNGALDVDGHRMDLDNLLAYLAPKLAVNPSKPVIVQPEAATPYGHMVAVLDELRQGRERLRLEREISIAIPTERERRGFWL
ncbi:MAG: biopolymer transporter ExbD [Acidobacteriota bacterium]|nr:biopolymer transporter ExbD [Acidobacteriota bacterium]